MGRHQETCHDIAQHQRLLEPLEHKRYDSSYDKNQCEVFDQRGKFRHDLFIQIQLLHKRESLDTWD